MSPNAQATKQLDKALDFMRIAESEIIPDANRSAALSVVDVLIRSARAVVVHTDPEAMG